MRKFISGFLFTVLLVSGLTSFGAVTVTVNGSNYTIPQTGEKGWGNAVTTWIQAVSQYSLQPSGGIFNLTSDVDFGSSFGLKSIYFQTKTVLPSTVGGVRLAVSDSIGWRNNTNSGNLLLTINGSDQLLFNGNVVAFSSPLTASRAVVTDGSGALSASTTTSAQIGYLASTTSDVQTQINGKQATGNYVTSLTGDVTASGPGAAASIIGAGKVTNSMLAGSIDLTSKVTGALPLANGGTGQATKAAAFDALSPMSASGDILYGGTAGTGTRLAKGSDGQFLTLSSGVPAWTANPARTSVPAVITKYAAGATSHDRSVVFVVSGVTSAGLGATYTNNGNTFTVRQAYVTGASYVVFSGTGTPLTSGTLTKSAGTGQASITFSQALLPISLEYALEGGGGGGGGSGASAGNGTAGGNAVLNIAGASVTAGGGGGGQWAGQSGGSKGTCTLSTVVNAYCTSGGGGGGATGTGTELYWPGGMGGDAGCGGGGGNSGSQAGVDGGGGAGGTPSGTGGPGGGGGGGACVRGVATAENVGTWSFTLPVGGTAGTAGGGGAVGGVGGDTYLTMKETF